MNKKTLWQVISTIAFILTILIAIKLVFFEEKEIRHRDENQSENKQKPLDQKLKIRTLAGKEKTIGEYSGKVLLINFWASWCGPCMSEMPSIYKLQEKFKDQGFVVLAVNLDDDARDGVEILEKKFGKAPFEILNGRGSELLNFFEVSGVPHTTLVNKSGMIVFNQAGERDWIADRQTRIIEGLLK